MPAVAATVGCSSSPASGGGDGGADTGLAETSTMATADAGSLVVTPASASVLTCGTLQLTETGGATGGAWTVSPGTGAGTVSDAGDYAAPFVAPSSPAVSVSYTVGLASASAALQVATAFVGTMASVPINVGTDNVTSNPFEHQLAASGTHVYVGLGAQTVAQTSAFLQANIYASSDNGRTFTGPNTYHTGYLECVTIAVDSGDPNVVYLAYFGGHGDSTSNTGETLRLAVSTDGSKTFPVEYDLAESLNGGSLGSFICPDVTSPSPDHVIVVAAAQDGAIEHMATFVSGNRGAGIGPASQEGVATTVNADGGGLSASDTNGATTSACGILSDGTGGSPRVFSNGAGAACVAYRYNTGNACANNIAVQCSTDNGATWTSPTALGAPQQPNGRAFPTGSVSPSGKVAIVWLDAVATDAGTVETAFVTISKDGGKTFGTPKQYPVASTVPFGYANYPVVAWENDTVLWLSMTGSGGSQAALYVDKTCDDGVSWSGPVKVGPYGGTSLFLTSAGMMIAADISAGSSGGPSVMTFPLAPQ